MPGLPPVSSSGSFWDRAQSHMGLATQQFAAQKPKEETIVEPPGKTGGGALASTAGGALAGYQVTGNPYGAAGGAVLGLFAYLMS